MEISKPKKKINVQILGDAIYYVEKKIVHHVLEYRITLRDDFTLPKQYKTFQEWIEKTLTTSIKETSIPFLPVNMWNEYDKNQTN